MQAWDIKELVLKLKNNGLDIAEDVARVLVEETFNWVEESVKASENKLDDFVVVALPQLKEMALKAIDKIDGEVG